MRAAARELDPDRVKQLMREYRRDSAKFFEAYGGGPSTGYDLLDDEGRRYPPAAIVQAALGWRDVKGGLKHADSAGAALKANNFRVVRKGRFRSSKTKVSADALSKLKDIEETEAVASRKVRVGADALRKFALRHHIVCEVTAIEDSSLLRVSHIVPWSEDKSSRLDPDNVILLSSLWDSAFDRGLISFDDAGVAIFGSRLSKTAQRVLKRSEKTSLALNEARRAFLKQHREKFGFPQP